MNIKSTRFDLKNMMANFRLAKFHSSKKDDVKIYIDSKDVIKIILGLGGYDREIINRKLPEFAVNDLVHAHIYNGFLGACYILNPHQIEFKYNLEHWEANRIIFNTNLLKGFIEKALHNIRERSLEYSKTPFLYDSILDLYKIDYLSDLGWKKRLNHLYSSNKKILFLDDDQIDYIQTFENPVFLALKNALDEVRPAQIKINNADALALTILADRLSDFKYQSKGSLPIFFDRDNYFRSIIQRIGLEKYFTFSTTNNSQEQFWILQPSNYFEVLKLVMIDFTSDDNLIKIFDDLNSKIINSKRVSEDSKETISRIGKSIEKLQKTYLLKAFWKPKKHKSINDFIDYVEINIHTDFSDKLDEVSKLVLQDLKRHLEHYTIEIGTYNSIEPTLLKIVGIRQLQRNLVDYRDERKKFNPFLVFSLIKFSVNSDIEENIYYLLREIFIKSQIDFNKLNKASGLNTNLVILTPGIYAHIISPLKNGIGNSGDQEISKEARRGLTQGLIVLWVLGNYRLIIEIFEYLSTEYYFYSNVLIYLAALCKKVRTYEDYERIKKKVNFLIDYISNYEGEYGTSYKYQLNYRVALGISYIYGQLWEKLNPTLGIKFCISEGKSEPKPNNSRRDTKPFLDKTIEILRSAKDWLEEDHRYMDKMHRRVCYYTILNNYVYYITISQPDDYFKQIIKVGDVAHLASVSNDESVWQPTFNDTLAIVNLRKAAINRANGENYQHSLKEAENQIYEAIEHVLMVDDYEKFGESIRHIGVMLWR